jgi:hypothetical protein
MQLSELEIHRNKWANVSRFEVMPMKKYIKLRQLWTREKMEVEAKCFLYQAVQKRKSQSVE